MSKQNLFDWMVSEVSDVSDDVELFETWKGEGYCCYCNDDCDITSQCCGVCLRNGNALKSYLTQS